MADAADRALTSEELRALDDDDFFEAYKQGKAPRRKDHLTEDNWEQVDLRIPSSPHTACL